MTYSSWIRQKENTALALGAGNCGGTYAEGAIILCSAISAMARIWWPGKGRDKKRFIQAIIRFATSKCNPGIISVPLLGEQSALRAQQLRISNKSYYLTGAQDKTETDILHLCVSSPPTRKKVREYSYACLLYEQVRCNFVHEYRTGNNATDGDQLRDIFGVNESQISYTKDTSPRRRIYFPLIWISEVAKNTAQGLDKECLHENKHIFEDLSPKNDPWWIEGD